MVVNHYQTFRGVFNYTHVWARLGQVELYDSDIHRVNSEWQKWSYLYIFLLLLILKNIFKVHLFYLYEYTVAVFQHTRRGYQIALQMVTSHHAVAGIEFRISRRTIGAPNCWAIFPGPEMKFYTIPSYLLFQKGIGNGLGMDIWRHRLKNQCKREGQLDIPQGEGQKVFTNNPSVSQSSSGNLQDSEVQTWCGSSLERLSRVHGAEALHSRHPTDLDLSFIGSLFFHLIVFLRHGLM